MCTQRKKTLFDNIFVVDYKCPYVPFERLNAVLNLIEIANVIVVYLTSFGCNLTEHLM